MKNYSTSILLAAIMIFSGCTSAPPPDDGPEPESRNVALHRTVRHSSTANNNNTGRLITDGIVGAFSDSEWISAGNGEEWVYIDFGGETALQNVKVYWGENYATSYAIEISDDAKNWKQAADAVGAPYAEVETRIGYYKSRYLRILCRASSGENYVIREVEVTGKNRVD